MAKGDTVAAAGLVMLGLAEVPQIMSAFLPSPTTAYMGGSDPVRVAWLRRGEVTGSGVAMGIAAGVTLIAAREMGPHAAWIFIGALAVLAIFLYEYERAIRMGKRDGGGQAKGSGY